MTYLSFSVQVCHSVVVGPSANKVISVLPGRWVLGGIHAGGKGKCARAEGRINENRCKKCGRPTGLNRVTPLQRTSEKQLKERGGDRGEEAGIERNNSQGGGEESKRGKEQVSTACHWPPGVNNPSQIDLPARPSRAF